jgi:hypothetical protein
MRRAESRATVLRRERPIETKKISPGDLDMKTAILAALALTAGFALAAPSDAAGGCGGGWHRGPYGGCRRNLVVAPVAVAPVVAVAPSAEVIMAPVGRVCPRHYHLGPQGRRCWPN